MSVAIDQAVRWGVIPVVEIDDAGRAGPLAETFLQAGLGVIEITMRTPAAADVIARIVQHHPDMLVGAGTVVRPDDLDRALDAGARFALAPGLSRTMVEHARSRDLPYVPGVMTPSDLQAGLELGLDLFKFFPAMQAGGLALLRAMAAPFALASPRFIPTGGISQAALGEWLGDRSVAAVGGSWIATRQAIAEGDWAAIRSAARAALDTVAAARSLSG